MSVIYHDQAIDLGSDGSIVLAGAASLGYDQAFQVVKYDSTGEKLWGMSLRHTSDRHSVWDVDAAVAPSGDVYLVGTSWSDTSSWDIVTARLTASGYHRWTRRYNGPGNSSDRGSALSLDSDGLPIVVGKTLNLERNHELVVLRYDTAGVLLWAHRYDPGSGNQSEGRAVATTLSGRIYAAGKLQQQSAHALVVGLGVGGDTCWARFHPGDGTAITVSDAGAVFVGGMAPDSSAIRTWAISQFGELLWNQDWHRAGGTGENTSALASGPAGACYVLGRSTTTESGTDYVLVKYSATGAENWVAMYDGPSHANDWPHALFVGLDGSAVVTGASESEDGTTDFLTIRYPHSGPGIADGTVRCVTCSRIRVLPSVARSTCLLTGNACSDGYRFLISDMSGRIVRRLSSNQPPSNCVQAVWELDDNLGHQVPNGVYCVTLDSPGHSACAKIIVQR
ncbi:MAG: hypothetical protein JSU73_10325 [candidate division WOR-3 bacterium]|nr:MAG: hypothetical protein JSU73_10325 [candidate division WOR-3 bacterium]